MNRLSGRVTGVLAVAVLAATLGAVSLPLPAFSTANQYQATLGVQGPAVSLLTGSNKVGTVSVDVLPALAAGSNTIGSVNLAASTSGGASPFFVVTTAGHPASTQIKASAGQLYSLSVLNIAAADTYIQVFNVPVATVGTTVPVYVLAVASSSNAAVSFPGGLAVGGTGISFVGTTTPTGASTASVALSAAYK